MDKDVKSPPVIPVYRRSSIGNVDVNKLNLKIQSLNIN